MAVTLLCNSSALKVTDAFLWNQSVGISQRGKKCRKNPQTQKSPAVGFKQPWSGATIQGDRETCWKPRTEKKLFTVYWQKCFAKAQFSQQVPGPLGLGWLCPSPCLTPSTENCGLQRQVAPLPSTITQVVARATEHKHCFPPAEINHDKWAS